MTGSRSGDHYPDDKPPYWTGTERDRLLATWCMVAGLAVWLGDIAGLDRSEAPLETAPTVTQVYVCPESIPA